MTASVKIEVGTLRVNGVEVLRDFRHEINFAPRVALVGCSSQKALARAKAKDLYGSALFRAARAYAEKTCERWYILSAKFGLLDPERAIDPYDLRLDARAAKGWGERVGRQLAEIPHQIESNTELIVLAGELYADAIEPFRNREFLWQEPLRGLGIGRRIAWLKENTPK